MWCRIVLIWIGDIDGFVEPDSKTSANVTDESQFKALKHRSQEIKELARAQQKHTEDTSVRSNSQRRIYYNIVEQKPRCTEQVLNVPREDTLFSRPEQEYTDEA